MPSGLRVTRIDRAPAAGLLPVVVNGRILGSLPHHTSLELTVAPGELLLELLPSGCGPLIQVLDIAPGCTARVRIGRRCSLGLLDASHYLQVDQPLLGLPDRSLHPLNLSAHSALEWLQEKRAMGEGLTPAQTTYLLSRLPCDRPACPTPRHDVVPSLAELGAFAALGLASEASEAEVRQAHRLLKSIHGESTGTSASETLRRLDEAFRLALDVLARQGVRTDVSEVGR
ncbi:MAG: hypothetical protein ACK6BG_03235 [Cyanobacteriota bacterium]